MSKPKKSSKKSKSTTLPLTTHVFKAVKRPKAVERAPKFYASEGGVRALVVKCLGRKGATATQVAAQVARKRKGYTPQSALNCLRWLQSNGNVERVRA